ncbi:hypothetical protein PHYBLDRAFT_63993 [Phycomyces blakesleeanus NRRL 1555(-)]|uniref:Uncharacterized protein n=1 Tax=Phycomyces blakesleeanus (strain ATCC 8743b / DSM 1359 / FGSC 10004 / NBRC 33097 / NRRL 1555) TaxID=763407 RepID=A0A167LRA3_PHYB8|nr:hypothetical protein PHYBLDRAFT_63993 [Phycomyces blakesleeanus NRRL 1555(-)]OAD70938.1 hypothetical protein PHYBLDRAFT_63993 [Phycomyces blakesleeanus NRRL 1555(-)]|eukprot:XP_018288978.1 hypothetical protein PHYBLDRAFT_63993 [Phycomyces blakesleeanus NRRL 1555(-)]
MFVRVDISDQNRKLQAAKDRGYAAKYYGNTFNLWHRKSEKFNELSFVELCYGSFFASRLKHDFQFVPESLNVCYKLLCEDIFLKTFDKSFIRLFEQLKEYQNKVHIKNPAIHIYSIVIVAFIKQVLLKNIRSTGFK